MFNRKNSMQDMDAYVEERLSDYLDGTLSEKERAKVEAHLAQSESARASLEALRYTVNLLKQTPAPPLPRQFTLPVTSRAPAQGAPLWLVWSLRGVGVAATVAFVALMVGLLFNQRLPNSAATSQVSEFVPPTAAVAMVAPTQVPSAEQPQAQKSVITANPTPIPVTVELPAAPPQPIPVTTTPDDLFSTQQAPAQQDSANPPATNVPPPAQPTAKPANTEQPEPTQVIAAANAAGASAEEMNVATPTPTDGLVLRTAAVTLEGVVTLSQLKVHDGPDADSRTIGSVRAGETVKAIGRSEDSAWLLIEFVRNRRTGQGWVSEAYVRLNGLVESLPIVPLNEPGSPTLMPTATDTPTETPTNDSSDDSNGSSEATPEATAVPSVTLMTPTTPVVAPNTTPEPSTTVEAPQSEETEEPTGDPGSGRGGTKPPTE